MLTEECHLDSFLIELTYLYLGKCSATLQKHGCYHGTLKDVKSLQWLRLLDNKTGEASLEESLLYNISCTCAEKAKYLDYNAFQLETRYLGSYSKYHFLWQNTLLFVLKVRTLFDNVASMRACHCNNTRTSNNKTEKGDCFIQ